MITLNRRTKGEVVFDIVNNIGMLCICFVTLYPIWYVLINAFNDGKDAMLGGIYWFPRKFSLENFSAVFNSPGIMRAMWLTVAKTLLGVGLHVFFTAMVAYAFSAGTDWGQILHPVRHDNHDLRRRTYSDVPTHQRSSSARKFPGLYYSGHVQLLRSNHLHDLLPGYS